MNVTLDPSDLFAPRRAISSAPTTQYVWHDLRQAVDAGTVRAVIDSMIGGAVRRAGRGPRVHGHEPRRGDGPLTTGMGRRWGDASSRCIARRLVGHAGLGEAVCRPRRPDPDSSSSPSRFATSGRRRCAAGRQRAPTPGSRSCPGSGTGGCSRIRVVPRRCSRTSGRRCPDAAPYAWPAQASGHPEAGWRTRPVADS